MANWYVSKNGSDANNGTTWALAKLTWAGVFAVALTGDSIYAGQGIYYESLAPGNKTLYIYCFNVVIIDGNNVLSPGLAVNHTNQLIQVMQGLFIIQKCSVGISTSGATQENFRGFIVRNCGTGVAVGGVPANMNDILITNCITGITRNSPGILYMGTCTVTKCTTGYTTNQASANGNWYNSVFAFNTTHIVFSGAFQATMDYNDVYFDGTAKCTRNGIDYITLADWQTATGQDANSTSEDPLFVDKDKYAIQVDPASPLLTIAKSRGAVSSSNAKYRGYNGNPSYGVSKNTTDDWSDGIFVDTEVDGNGDLALSFGATIGTWSSPVKDMGVKRRILKTICNTDESKVNFPGVKVDQDNTSPEAGDTPNRAQFEARISDTAFLKTDVLPAWTVYNLGIELNITGRYFQTRLTLRNDGVV